MTAFELSKVSDFSIQSSRGGYVDLEFTAAEDEVIAQMDINSFIDYYGEEKILDLIGKEVVMDHS